MLTKTELKEIFSRYGFRPLKRLGENYLVDANIKDKIIESLAADKEGTVLEIGPGLGALTLDLAESGARIYAVEKDKKAFGILNDLAGESLSNLKIINEDILKYDLKKAATEERKVKIVGNLPYYITTPIIEYLIENRALIECILITVQKEVANRLLAEAGSKDYASISCFVQYYTRPAYLYTIKRSSFYPVPEVDSSLIRLDILERPSVDVKNEKMLFKIIRGAFNQRRKSIINSLSREAVLDIPKDRLEKVLQNAGIDPNSRPESLSLSSFAKISNTVSS